MLYKLHAIIILRLLVDAAAQFPAGQYAFPQMSAPMPGQMGGPMAPIPGPMQMQVPPGPMHIGQHPISLNSPFQIPQQRLPVVVMPYRSKTADRKHNRRRRIKKKFKDSSSSSSSESTSSSREYALRSKKKQKRKLKRQVLTPVISYMTRNGDVIYQKKVKKDKAGDWLDLGKSKTPSRLEDESKEETEDIDSQEMTVRDLKKKFNLKSRKRKHRH